MNTAWLFWHKMNWMFALALALLVTGCASFLTTHQPAQTPTHAAATSQPAATITTCGTLLPREAPPDLATVEFKTDFSKHCVPYSEILSGGPPKDGIPALNTPKFISVSAADTWLKPNEPVIFFQVGDDARAYPIQILIWHEIVNDTVGGVPVAITFCPLCNTAIAYERSVNGHVLDFGTTGRLRYSNLVMNDRRPNHGGSRPSASLLLGNSLEQSSFPSRPPSLPGPHSRQRIQRDECSREILVMTALMDGIPTRDTTT